MDSGSWLSAYSNVQDLNVTYRNVAASKILLESAPVQRCQTPSVNELRMRHAPSKLQRTGTKLADSVRSVVLPSALEDWKSR